MFFLFQVFQSTSSFAPHFSFISFSLFLWFPLLLRGVYRFIDTNDVRFGRFPFLPVSSAFSRRCHPVGGHGCQTSSSFAEYFASIANDSQRRTDTFHSPSKSSLGGNVQFHSILDARSTQNAGQ